MKVQLVDSWRFALRGRIGRHRIPRPQGGELALFLAGKAIFFAWAFVIPMLLHPVWVVLFYYVVAALMLGVVMVLVFIVPHLNGVGRFPRAPGGHRADGKPLDGPSGTSRREFRPAQPGPDLAGGRAELSQGTPPVPCDLPHQLPVHLARSSSRPAASSGFPTRSTSPSRRVSPRITAGCGGWEGPIDWQSSAVLAEKSSRCAREKQALYPIKMGRTSQRRALRSCVRPGRRGRPIFLTSSR